MGIIVVTEKEILINRTFYYLTIVRLLNITITISIILRCVLLAELSKKLVPSYNPFDGTDQKTSERKEQ